MSSSPGSTASRWSSPASSRSISCSRSGWCCEQIKEGPLRDREPICPHRARRAAMRRRLRRWRSVYELREFFEWRGPRLDRSFRRQVARRICPLRRRAEIRHSERHDRRSQILPVRRGAQGRDQALAVQGVRHGLHAGDAARRADGVVGRRLRGLLPIWRRQAASRPRNERRSVHSLPDARPGPRADGDARAWRRRQGDEGSDRRRFRPGLRQSRCWRRSRIRRVSISRDLTLHGDRLAFTTNSFVVDPLIFPGGDIGKLAVCGTINDLAVGGAMPLYLACAAIIEEGVTIDFLRQIARSMAGTAAEAGVEIVTGDTKVVHKGACDKLFITTTGIGVIREGVDLGAHLRAARRRRPGQRPARRPWRGDPVGARRHGAVDADRKRLRAAPRTDRRAARSGPRRALHARRDARRALRPCSTRSPRPLRSLSRSTRRRRRSASR